MSHPERTPAEWMQEAARCHVDDHQGCAWCGEANAVYKSERDGRLEYRCGDCEFFVCQELATGRIFMTPGECRPARAPITLHSI